MNPCPCGLGEPYPDCCGRFHDGSAAAPTAEALMRSRYSAFAVRDAAYLSHTWHPDTRPKRVHLDPRDRWTGLRIVDREAGGLFDTEGVVEFEASHTGGVVRERSRFVRHDGLWVYLDAVTP